MIKSVENIVESFKCGKNVNEISRLFKCCVTSVYNILHRNNLNVGSRVCLVNTDLTLENKQVIEGLLLGDGSVWKLKRNKNNCISVTTIHQEFAEHIKDILPFKWRIQINPAHKQIIKGKECNVKESYKVVSRVDLSLNFYRDIWYPNGKKIVPRDLVLSPKSVKYWFYGDGSSDYTKSGRRLQLSTDGFSEDDVELLRDRFIDVGLKFNINHSYNKPVLVINRADAINCFFNYIGKCDLKCFDYKWKI